MFGNKFSGDDIAKEFQKRIASMKGTTKQASQKTAMPAPEDFLVAPTEAEPVDSELTAKIDDVAAYADDQVNAAEDQAEDAAEDQAKDQEMGKCEKCECSPCECCEECEESKAEDSYYISNEAAYVMTELGKMAGKLRRENKAFAADMVEATAMSIKNDLVKEASQKVRVVEGLKRMAHDMYQDGDSLSGDILTAALKNIRK